MATVTPVAVAVVAAERTTVVAFVTEAIVVPAVIPVPATSLPLSACVNAAVAEVRAVFVLVTPSVTERVP